MKSIEILDPIRPLFNSIDSTKGKIKEHCSDQNTLRYAREITKTVRELKEAILDYSDEHIEIQERLLPARSSARSCTPHHAWWLVA